MMFVYLNVLVETKQQNAVMFYDEWKHLKGNAGDGAWVPTRQTSVRIIPLSSSMPTPKAHTEKGQSHSHYS